MVTLLTTKIVAATSSSGGGGSQNGRCTWQQVLIYHDGRETSKNL